MESTHSANRQIATTSGVLRWGSMNDVIGSKRMNSQLEQIKYGIRYYLSRDSRNKFLLKVSDSDFGRKLFESNPSNFYVPLRSYLDNRFTVKDRFEVCLQDIETAQDKFTIEHSLHLLNVGSICLAQVGQFTVDLQMNRVSQHEGFWAISIKDEFGKSFSNLSFGFLNSQSILIASVQGIKDGSRDVPALNKQLTKDSYGFRPQNLLVATLQALCFAWKIDNLIGIDPRNQVKRKINTKRQGFNFDYTVFWTELGAAKNFTGYWSLKNTPPVKDMADVPSHKRNQYRKRNALIEAIRLESVRLFNAH